MTDTMPKYYRFKAGTVTKYSYSEIYYFENAQDCETFKAWAVKQNPKEIVHDFNTLTIYWNRA